MKKLIFPLATILVVIVLSFGGCTREAQPSHVSNDFIYNGVHITIKDGCPTSLKSSVSDKAISITGAKGNVQYTLYCLSVEQNNGFKEIETYTEDGRKIGSYVLYDNQLISFELSSELDNLSKYDTKSDDHFGRHRGETYHECVNRESHKMLDSVANDHDIFDETIYGFLGEDITRFVYLVTAMVMCGQKDYSDSSWYWWDTTAVDNAPLDTLA